MSTRFYIAQGMEPPFAKFMDSIHNLMQECIDCVSDPQAKRNFTRSLVETKNSWMTQFGQDGSEKIISFVSVIAISDNEYRIIYACSTAKNPIILTHMIQELMVRIQLDSCSPKTFVCLTECEYVVEALVQLGFNFNMSSGELIFSPTINFKLLSVPLVMTKIHRTLEEFLMPTEVDILKRTLRMLDLIQQEQQVASLKEKWPTTDVVDKLQLVTAIARSKTEKLLTMMEIKIDQFYPLYKHWEMMKYLLLVLLDQTVTFNI